MAEIDIRPLTPADREAWRRLWTDYLTFYGTKVTPEVYDTTFARLLSDDANEFCCHLAWREEQAVGLVHFLSHRHCWRIENVVYLQDLYVAEAARGTGTGRALIESVYARADANGTPAVYWLTREDNVTARQLYDHIAAKTDFIKYQR